MRDRSFFDPGFSHTRNTTEAASRQSRSKALFDIVARSYGRGLCDREYDGKLMTDLVELPMTRDEADEFRRLMSNASRESRAIARTSPRDCSASNGGSNA